MQNELVEVEGEYSQAAGGEGAPVDEHRSLETALHFINRLFASSKELNIPMSS